MDANRFEKAKQDVAAAFDAPLDISEAADLTQVQKLELLRRWESDLSQLLTATDEGMAGPTSGSNAERLRAVRKLLADLDGQH